MKFKDNYYYYYSIFNKIWVYLSFKLIELENNNNSLINSQIIIKEEGR